MSLINFFKNDNLWLSNLESIIAILVLIMPIVTSLIRHLLMYKNRIRYRPDCLSEDEIEKYTRIFIPTRLLCNECKFHNRKFINKYILASTKQYHLILGDTGTGKSAFLINSYFYFLLKVFKRGYSINYFTLRDSQSLEKISLLENKKRTILLLDAFDESIQAATNAQQMIKQLEIATKDFSKIIITSRIHFFDNQSDEPNTVSVTRAIDLDENKYQKYYILPFTNKDVSLYLNKKFKFNLRKHYKAKVIVKKSADIMSRPLVLSLINFLLDYDKRYKYSYEIYETVVLSLVNREVKFLCKLSPYVQRNLISESEIKKHYIDFLNQLSIEMYYNIEKLGAPLVNIDTLEMQVELKDFFCDYSRRNRTVLERKMDSMFSFSHRSILEYFLANNINKIEDFKFDINLNQMYRFLAEMYENDCPCTRKIIKTSSEKWYENIEEIKSSDAKIEYTNNQDDGMIFEFKNYNCTLITENLKEIIITIKNQQKMLYKINRTYAVHNINSIIIELQHGINKEDISILFTDIINSNNAKLSITENTHGAFSRVQLIGQYNTVYKA